MTTRREAVAALGALATGGLLALWATRATWVSLTTVEQLTIAATRTGVEGRDIRPLLAPATYVGLAGALALLATRRIGRRLVGATVCLAGFVVLASAGSALVAGDTSVVLDATAAAGGCLATGPCPPGEAAVSSVWPVLALVGGVLLTLAGALAAVRGPRWPALGSSYESPSRQVDLPVLHRDTPPAGEVREDQRAVATDKAVWAALDRGDDPTT